VPLQHDSALASIPRLVATVARASFYHAAPPTRAFASTSSIRDVLTAASALSCRLSTAPRQAACTLHPVHPAQSCVLTLFGTTFF